MPISPHQLTLEEPISAAPASLDAPTQHGYSDSRLPAQPLPGKRHILDLPPELLIQSLSHLDPPDIATSERVCKDWFSTCRDDACWRTAFFNRYQASTAPGKRLHKSAKTSWKAEYLLRSKMLRLWAKSSAKSRVADLKLSHLTNLELLSQGGALVASSWSGRAQTLSPATLKPTKISLLPDSNLHDEVIAVVLNQDYIFWVTHAQICAIDLHFKASTRVLDTGMGSIAAVAGVNGQDTLFVVAFLNGSLAVYDAVACTKVWETLEDQRLQDGDGVPLTVRAVVANDSYIVAVTDHSLHLIPYATTISAESPWMKQFDLQLNYVALDGSHVLLHQHDALSISRYHQGDLIKEYISDTESFITSIAYDLDFVPTSFSAAGADFGQHKTVLAGRADGSVDIWFWDDSSPPLTTAKPVRTMKPDFKADPMRVTALAMSDILLFVGYLDGCIQAFDLLTGQLVRIFNDQSTPRHALRQVLLGQADERRWQVSRLAANDRTVYATLGERLWTWTCTEAIATKKKKRRGPRLSNRAERFREEQEIEEDLLELEAASLPRRPTVGRPQFSLESLLSPDEAMQYAQLLSVEAEEERRSRLAEQSAELDFDLEQLLAQDEAEHDLRRSDESPVISEHDYEDFFENTRSVTIGSTTRSPHLSPDLRSRGSTSSFNRLDDGQISATMDDDSHFPSLSTSPLRTSGASPSPPECTPASAASPWSAVLRRPMASPSSSAAASHGSPGPFCTPSRPLTHSQEDEDEEDADLKLAIQLSLLETSGGT